MGNELAFALHGGIATVYEAFPDPATVPAVIVLHGRWGFAPYVPRLCDRLAAEGFSVQAPDLYYGKLARSATEAETLMQSLSLPAVGREIYACVASLTDHIKTARKKVGLIGFGMGGQMTHPIARRFPQIAACVDLYGDQTDPRANGKVFPCPILRVTLDFSIPQGLRASDPMIPQGIWLEMVAFLREKLSVTAAR